PRRSPGGLSRPTGSVGRRTSARSISSSCAPARIRSCVSGTILPTWGRIRARPRGEGNRDRRGSDRAALEEERTVFLPGARRIGHRELPALAGGREGVHDGAAVLTRLAHRVEADVEIWPARGREQTLFPCAPGDPFQRHQAGLARVLPL